MLARILRLCRRDGDNLRPHEREHGGQHRCEHRAHAVRQEALRVIQVTDAADLAVRQQTQHRRNAQQHEANDRNDLDQCEPELELPVVLHAEQVGRGQQQSDHQRERPDGHVREPRVQNRRGGVGFQRNDQHPEPPVQPTDGEAGPVPDRAVGVGRKRTGVRRSDSHFRQHPHHQHYQRTCGAVGQKYGRPGFGNRVPGADEEAGADNASDREHGDVPRFEPLFKV